MKESRSYYIIFSLLTAAFLTFLVILNHSIQKTPLLAEDGSSFEKAVVTKIIKDNIGSNGERNGEQTVEVRITSGSYKGKTVKATSLDGYLYGAVCKVGSHVIINVSAYGNTLSANVYNYDRTPVMLSLIHI